MSRQIKRNVDTWVALHWFARNKWCSFRGRTCSL